MAKINLYKKHQRKREREVNKFPMFFAFDDKQFEAGLKKLNVDKSGLVSIGAGGFIRKKDKAKYIAMQKRHFDTHKKLMKNKNYVYDMFKYEMANHEYAYTHDSYDTLSSLGLSMEQVQKNPLLLQQWKKAEEDYLNSQEW